MNIGIYIYNQAEVLDFSGPFEVFSTAKRLGADSLNVFLVSESSKPVVARGGFKVLSDYSLQKHPPIDLLIVVGGVHTDEMCKLDIMTWLSSVVSTASEVASVCTGVFLLAQTGLIKGLTVTTHWEDIPDLATRFPDLNVVSNQRWVTSGKFTTSGGISAGIDMSLNIVSKHYGQQLADTVARQMEYNWQKCT
ncbi:DJ-1/PfpI family protein [Vibrio parahaemolyticus]|uniref:DJ-1/PfpI family protein n=1 Tax=Vibrio harveyi group TaxID=717610 RepID=UPI000426CBA5|nr:MULTISPECIES: DJ-1/PfpI family protein [Vibrio harveyi group]KON51930.1 glutamine amidotransferase [Vibrio parahaemolyticus]MCR9882233.1 DJ-1/PfpI family protein [Vibrio alginolyticus]MCS0032533.1 DJ-1/PfpI family protein [Vibrio parahaemolyticus]